MSGRCTRICSEEVCEADIDTLQSLIDKSLISRQAIRFSMLETVREYAAEQLRRRGEAPLLAEKHADYLITLAEAAGAGSVRERQAAERALSVQPSAARRVQPAPPNDFSRSLSLWRASF